MFETKINRVFFFYESKIETLSREIQLVSVYIYIYMYMYI